MECMSDLLSRITEDLSTVLDELNQKASLKEGQILVIGTSTSEVKGEHIGTAGTTEIADAIWKALDRCQKKTGIQLAFQCCEHLNRALVVEETTARDYRLDEVAAIPMPRAGGSMAAFAYRHMNCPVLVESIQAHAGIDIGDTFIGMHLRPVAVPVRSSVKALGDAHITLARTRPKLIGGERAVYTSESSTDENNPTCE